MDNKYERRKSKVQLKEGYTLMHEHLTIDLSSVKNDRDCILDCYEETVKELNHLYQLGVRNIVDVTNIGMGRNTEYADKIERNTGIHIIRSTGFYKEPFFPEVVYDKTVEELSKLMEHEIENGIDETSVKAEMIGEIGTSKDKMEPTEQKVFEAAVRAAKKTGKPIYTHTTLGTFAKEQVEFLLEGGIKPEKIVIGHIDLTGNYKYIEEVLKKGVFVGFDTVGKNNYFPDKSRVQYLIELEKIGLLKQVVLSMDLTRKSHLKFKGGIGYTYLFETFLPMLREAGMQEESIRQMLIYNPMKILE